MKKVVRLTERDLTNIIKRVIQEETSPKEKGKDLLVNRHNQKILELAQQLTKSKNLLQ